MVNIIQDYIPVGRNNRPGLPNPCIYITIHNTGNSAKGAGAKNHASYVKSDEAANACVSWHYTVDDSIAYKHLPDKETAYHAGDGSGPGNTKSIGIEICMNSDGDLRKATDNAVGLAAALCVKHNIPVTNVVQHSHWSSKDCPQKLRRCEPYCWDTFIEKVRSAMEQATSCRFDLFDKIVEIPGMLINGTNYVSARQLLEAMGFTVGWDTDTQTVIVGLSASWVNIDLFGEQTVAVPGRLVDGTNYVALRPLMESMGVKVEWDSETRTVILSVYTGGN